MAEEIDDDFSLEQPEDEKKPNTVPPPPPIKRPMPENFGGGIHAKKPTQQEMERYGMKEGDRRLSNPEKGAINRQKLNDNVEDIVEMIIGGASFRKICATYNVPMQTYFTWRLTSQYSSLIEAAMIYSSECDVEKAEEILLEEAGEKDIANVQRRRELSQFYRWRASKRNPKVFGNKTEIEQTVNINTGVTKDEMQELLQAAKERVKQRQSKDISDAEIIEETTE